MHNDRQLQDLIAARAAPSPAKPAFIVLLLLAWVLAVYGQTTWSMVTIWERSETFAHGFVVVPIVLYLLWRNRAAIDAIAPRPWLHALAGIASLGVLWLVASRLRVNSVAQFAMIAMIPLSVWAVLGTAALRALAFPLAFLFFAVPVGEFMLPRLIEWTADVTVAALRATGVPVYREGNFFTIPTGQWSVVEACSGLRYLIASLMVGCLFAYLSFRSPVRRVLFIACAIAVPIVANWIRAYGIVMLGHLSQNRIAVGADHLLYGWLFFGIVMILLFWIGSRWREDLESPRPAEVTLPSTLPAAPGRALKAALVATLGLTLAFPLFAFVASTFDMVADRRGPATIVGRAGWNPVPGRLSDWRPDVEGFTSMHEQTFIRNGTSVGVIVAYFGDPRGGEKPISSTNQLVREANRQWAPVAGGTTRAVIEGENLDVRSAIIVRAGERLAAWQWFWIDGHATSSEFVATFYQALAELRGRSAPVAWIVLVTPADRGDREAHAVLAQFAAEMKGAVDAALPQATVP